LKNKKSYVAFDIHDFPFLILLFQLMDIGFVITKMQNKIAYDIPK